MSLTSRLRLRSAGRWFTGLALLSGSAAVVLLAQTTPGASSAPKDAAKSEAAFRKLAPVLRDPRCMNCHPAGDFPRQGDERRRHDMLVMRGADDHGVPAMKCSSCHQNINQENGVPGAPNWGLAPLAMAWENLDDTQLADVLKDPAKNGQRSLEKLYDHMAHDELVGWGWQPGGNRRAIAMPRAEFAALVREWIDNGAVSPKSK